jgi:hypothetical protein
MIWLHGYVCGVVIGALAIGITWRVVTILKQPKRDARGRFTKRGN